MRSSRTTRRGLSLVELVVVLTILVVLAGVAVTATESAVEDARYQATRSTLANVEDALLGRWASPTGSPSDRAPGFVADVGRLPKLVSSAPGEELSELWTVPAGAPAFGVQSPDGDPQVRLLCGWRGPYVRLAFASATELDGRDLLDGWARPFVVRRSDGVVATVGLGDEIAQIHTLGADGIEGGTAYDEDLALVVHRTVAPLVAPRHRGALTLRVTPFDGVAAFSSLVVRVYGPRDGRADTLRQHAPVTLVAPGVVDVLLSDLTIGTRVVRVYQLADAPATEQTDLSAALHKSALVHVEVVPGGNAQPLEIVVP